MARSYSLDLALSATVEVPGSGAKADERAAQVAEGLVRFAKEALHESGLEIRVDALEADMTRGTRGGKVFEALEGDLSCLAR